MSKDLRAAVEALAADFESEIDWSSSRWDYSDNAAWERAARRLRDLLAEHPEPATCTHAGEYPCPECGECFHCHDECREDR
jgi:hypothetical protein